MTKMRKVVIVSAISALTVLPVSGWAHSDGNPSHAAYWKDSPGQYVKDGNGRCVNTGAWSAGTLIEGCDKTEAPVVAVAPVDGDSDGVMDADDRCLHTPAGVKVDPEGCQIKAKVLKTVNLNLSFATNSADIADADYSNIGNVAEFMRQVPNTRAYIEGHTDSLGEAAYNMDLSSRRAQTVVDMLVGNFGIPGDRVKSEEFGESRPIANNDSREGRSRNRRVTVVVKGWIEE